MTGGGPFQSLLSSSFLSPKMIKVDFSITGSFFCFLDTLGLSSEIPFLPFLIPTSPLGLSLVKTCFKSMIPEKLQVSFFSCRGCSITKPNNVVNVSKGDEHFKINRIV